MSGSQKRKPKGEVVDPTKNKNKRIGKESTESEK